MASLKASLDAGASVGKGKKTKANRRAAVRRFCNYLHSRNLSGLRLANLKAKHVEAYGRDMLNRGRKPRTVQSEMSALRVAIREAGRPKLADGISNERLGITGASRAGAHRSMPDELRESIKATLVRRGHPGVAACVDLERYLGCRAQEALIGGGRSLERWRRELLDDGQCYIQALDGPKNGKSRWVAPADVRGAVRAVEVAIEATHCSSMGWLVKGPENGLQSAYKHYGNVMRSAGASGQYSGHALRCAFAETQYHHYHDEMRMGLKEALRAISHDLGHGDGRGRYVRRVYLVGVDLGE